MAKPHVFLISPALEKANNGNWQTARRWARILRLHFRVSLGLEWDSSPCDIMIALHARRSASSIAAFSTGYPAHPLVVVLTGTDLYRDIHHDASAQHSLQVASRLVVLQQAGVDELPVEFHAKTQVIHQSSPFLKPVDPLLKADSRYFDVVMIGHLRAEKDPATFMRAAALINSAHIRLTHIGAALDAALGAQAQATQLAQGNYRWLGNQPHAATRQRLKRSHLMVIASVMEGGANVIIESVTSGVPVLASAIPGNRGMLGDDYAGYFTLGDSAQLARLIERAAEDPAFYRQLQSQCEARASLFLPQREQAALLELMQNIKK